MKHDCPEQQFIQAVCRHALGATPHLPRHLSINEPKLLGLLKKYGIVLIAHHALSGGMSAPLSDDCMKAIRNQAHKIINQQLKLHRLCLDVNRVFKAGAIPHVFLKGPVLNKILWGNQMLRYSNDLDVLIKPCDIPRAHKALNALGFHIKLPSAYYKFHQLFHRITTKKDIAYEKPGFPFKIELHWKSSRQEFFKSWDKHCTETDALPSFPHSEYVLYLCLHASIHGWLRIPWLVDIVAYIQKYEIDITTVLSLAKAKQLTPVVDEAIYLANDWLGIPLAPAHEISIKSKRVRAHLIWGKMKLGFNHPLKRTAKSLILHHIHSGKRQQALLWAQVFCGAFFANIYRYVLWKITRRHVKTCKAISTTEHERTSTNPRVRTKSVS